jgi:hypothetical protein
LLAFDTRNQHVIRKSSTLLLLVLLIGSITLAEARPPRYRIVEVQVPPAAFGFGITNFNQKRETAVTTNDADFKARIWLGKIGRYRLVPIPAEEGSASAHALNDRSEILGRTSGTEGHPGHWFIWRRGQFEFLTPPPGIAWLDLRDMNNRNQIVGFMGDGPDFQRPVIWEEGHFSNLPVLTEELNAAYNLQDVTQINDAGVAVGTSSVVRADMLVPVPVMWLNGVIQQLPLPGSGYDVGHALAINKRNHIVGYARNDSSGESRPVLWRDGQVTSLPMPPGERRASALVLNDRGQILGVAGPPLSTSRALYWEHGAVYDLMSLVSDRDPLKQQVSFVYPQQILNSGEILLQGSGPDGNPGYFLLIPENCSDRERPHSER